MSLLMTAALLISSMLTFQTSTATPQLPRNEAAEHMRMEQQERRIRSIQEYKAFHDVLHPLQHEALPNKDYQTIRARAEELIAAGQAITRLGVPKRVKTKDFRKRYEFSNKLGEFKASLSKFKSKARNGSDTKLEKAFEAVHDSFEALAQMLPTPFPKR